MQMRNNVRQRRRDRIRQLTDEGPGDGWENRLPERRGEGSDRPDGEGMRQRTGTEAQEREEAEDRWEPTPSAPMPGGFASAPEAGLSGAAYEEPDPERWWREKQRQELGRREGRADGFFGRGEPARTAAPAGGEGPMASGGASGYPPGRGKIGSLSNLSPYRGLSGGGPGWDDAPPGDGGALRRFARSFMARFAWSAALLGAIWAWTHWELPGSGEVEGWTIRTVTQDMNFVAVEAWYERTFGGTPSFLPIFRTADDSQAVSASWSRDQTVPPLAGRVVRSFAQSGDGVRLAAPAGAQVKAVHTGRVTQVTTDAQGLATVRVQHANDVVTVYGNVAHPEVKANDWVEAGRTLGVLAGGAGGEGEGTLFFAVQRGGKAIDPAEVVPLD